MNPEARVATMTLPLLHPWSLSLDPNWWEPWTEEDWRDEHLAWVQAEGAASGVTQGTIGDLRKETWENDLRPTFAADALRQLAARNLTLRESGEIAVSEGSSMDLWFLLTRHIPSDLLCAAAWRYPDLPCPGGLTSSTQVLGALFGVGLWDLHVHWGAAFSYSELLPTFRTLDDATGFLSQGLEALARSGEQRKWIGYRMGHQANPLGIHLLHGLTAGVVRRCLNEEIAIEDPVAARRVREALLATGPCALRIRKTLRQDREKLDWEARADAAISRWRELLEPGVDPEPLSPLDAQQVAVAFELEARARPFGEDSPFLLAFDQMLRARTTVYDCVTQNPRYLGLEAFTTWFGKARRFREVAGVRWELRDRIRALELTGAVEGLEIRAGAELKPETIARAFVDYADTAIDGGNSRPSVFFSIGLRKPLERPEGPPDEAARRAWVRGAPEINAYVRQVERYIDVGSRHGAIFDAVRGLDTFGRETALPNWAPALVYQFFVRAATDPERIPRKPKVGQTFHAGEDWTTPVGGLRAMHEAIVGARLTKDCGHRLGHGLALFELGLRSEYPEATLGVYLDDLIWEWGIWRRHGDRAIKVLEDRDDIPADEFQATVKAEIETCCEHLARLAASVEGPAGDPSPYTGASPLKLWRAYELRFNFDALLDLGLVHDRQGVEWFAWETWGALQRRRRSEDKELTDVEKALRTYLCCWGLYEAEKTKLRDVNVVMPPRSEAKAGLLEARWKALRDLVSGEIESRGLKIEVCPSSNSVIGGYTSPQNHPIVQVASVGLPSFVAVGSDDPLIFNTTIELEYRRLYEALGDALRNRNEAERCVAALIRQSRDARFCKEPEQADLEGLRRYVELH